MIDYALEGDIAVIAVDNPPVNALGHALRAALVEAIDRFEADAGARIAVIHGAGRLFLGGADISEFGKPPKDPWLPAVCDRIEASAKPVVAAIHGAALGGGLEVALGCHWRLAMPGTKLGLPEVTLGILPGAGGTQRTPRLIGTEAAAEMIAFGAPVPPEKALGLGLIDRIGEGSAREAGIAYARDLLAQGAGPRRTSEMEAAPADLADLRARVARRMRGQPAPGTALDSVENAARLPFAEGMAEERRLFQGLVETPQRAALIHAFFAERAVAKLPEIEGVPPRPIASLGVIGGGTMGSGIATAALLAGLDVTLVERDAEAAEAARARIAGNLAAAAERGKIDATRRDALADALTTATEIGALRDADLAIEAVFEDMAVKRDTFAALDAAMKPGAILATNTSYLDVDEIAAVTGRPGDVIGLHFFSPAHVMKLLEVVVARETAPEVTATAFALARRLGKVPVRAGVCDGFIGNRILSRTRGAADAMVLDGTSPYAVDRALEAFGFPMGPYRVSDLAGLDIGFMTRERKAATAHPRDRRATFADALYHAGRLGQKTGKGYYDYTDDRRGAEDADALALVRQAQTGRRDLSEDEIVARYMAAMVDEGARVVDEGIALRPLDVDVVKLMGYGFPRWKGGPMHWADATGLDRIAADIRRFAEEDDHFWQVSPLLDRLAAEGGSFGGMNR